MEARTRRTPEERLALVRARGNDRKTLEEVTLELAIATGMHPKTMRGILDSFLDNLVSALHDGRTVLLPSFGSFRPHHREARKVRNPRETSGSAAFKQVGPSTAFKFKAGAALKPRMRG